MTAQTIHVHEEDLTELPNNPTLHNLKKIDSTMKKNKVFCKKNWMSLTYLSLSLIGLILAIVWLAEVGSHLTFMYMTATLTWLIFFIGTIAYFIAKMFFKKKCTPPHIMLVTGALVTIFGFINLVYAITRLTPETPSVAGVYMVIPTVFPLIVIGIFTLLRGVAETVRVKAKE